ncbi:hypothetical protein [Anaerotignum propionicum]|uniref:hypothetical protein n=1 Tax=Anaerotignum propionicum TaxID=28446 RepID=UPI00210BB567|nr:hypothetical protein [Anaerotignum propionicum]MCQ4936725.1 hypothetical protein [Anaerotignum propionicum]
MQITAIGQIYWQKVKDNERTYASVANSKKEEVKSLALEEVNSGKLTEAEYQNLLGEEFTAL